MEPTEHDDTLIAFGTEVRALERFTRTRPVTRDDGSVENVTEEFVRVGGVAVPFTDENNKDLYRTWWDANSYLGARAGDGMDCFVHHTRPLGTGEAFRRYADHRLHPASTRVDPAIGLIAETILNMNDEYEAMLAQRVEEGRLFWSSGSAPHLVRIDPQTGYVRQWPIIEISLTPTPGTPNHRTQITTLRALMDNVTPGADNADAATGTEPSEQSASTAEATPPTEGESASTASTDEGATTGTEATAGADGTKGTTEAGETAGAEAAVAITEGEALRTLTGNLPETIWTSYQCARAAAGILSAAAGVDPAAPPQAQVWEFAWWLRVVTDLLDRAGMVWHTPETPAYPAIVASTLAAAMTDAGRVCDLAAAIIADTTMQTLAAQSAEMCRMCASALAAHAGVAPATPTEGETALRAIATRTGSVVEAFVRSLPEEMRPKAIEAIRAGAQLNKANRADITSARDLATQVHEILDTVLARATAEAEAEGEATRSSDAGATTTTTNASEAAAPPAIRRWNDEMTAELLAKISNH